MSPSGRRPRSFTKAAVREQPRREKRLVWTDLLQRLATTCKNQRIAFAGFQYERLTGRDRSGNAIFERGQRGIASRPASNVTLGS